MKKLLILAILLSGCQNNDKADNQKISENLTYFKDYNTGLCFASLNSANSYGYLTSIACVPCDRLNLK